MAAAFAQLIFSMIEPHHLILCWLGLSLLSFIVYYLVNGLYISHLKADMKQVPDDHRHIMSKDSRLKSTYYTLDKIKFEGQNFSKDLLLRLLFLFSGIMPWIDSIGIQFDNPIHQSVFFILGLSMVSGLTNIPYDLYKTFRLEGAYGFNNTTLSLWLEDLLKGTLLSLVIGIPFLYIIFLFMEWANHYWWIWVFCFFTLFQIILILIYPSWIAPLFNRFRPLESGALRERLKQLAKRCGFALSDIQVMDGSRRSSHSNAYFTGLGSTKKIVLYDTLIKQLTEDELEAVLAHEIGHYKHNHILKGLGISLFMVLLFLVLIEVFRSHFVLYESFEVLPSAHTALFILIQLSVPVLFFISPLFSYFSRKNEYAADHYASSVCSTEALSSALLKIGDKNLSDPNPHPLYVFMHYSHPPISQRIAALNKNSGPKL
jgi:STE24 endopeptidase